MEDAPKSKQDRGDDAQSGVRAPCRRGKSLTHGTRWRRLLHYSASARYGDGKSSL